MRQTKKHRWLACSVVPLWFLAGVAPAQGQCRTTVPTYSSFLHLATWPDDESPGWHEEAQGLAHDEDHWYIMQREAIWRIPVTHDLSQDASSFPHRSIYSCGLGSKYDHFGDGDCYQVPGGGPRYVIVPVEGGGQQGLIAFISADDTLSCLGAVPLHTNQGASAGWAAVDPQGLLYSSGEDPVSNVLYVYTVNWSELVSQPPSLTFVGTITLLDENANPIAFSDAYPQAGEFSPDGSLFYHLYAASGHEAVNEGINVFETANWKRIKRSSQHDMPFLLNWSYFYRDEPEGLTFWDLTDCGAPGVGGELHVLVLNNNPAIPDGVYIRHYADSICVDGTFTGQSDWGKPHAPFKTVGEANDVAWNGARIKIISGNYPEQITFSKRLQLLSSGGLVRIGG